MRSNHPIRRIMVPLVWVLGVALVVAAQVQNLGSPVAPGVAESVTVAVPSPRVARLASLHVKVGEWIAPNQLLARLESPSLNDEISVAEAEFARLKEVVRAASVDLLDDARRVGANLSGQADDAALDVARLKATLQHDRAELASLKAQHARQAKLLAQQLVPAAKVDALADAARVLRARIGATRASVRQAEANARAGASRVEAEVPTELGRRLAPHRLAVQVQHYRLDSLLAERGRLELRAPASGLVASIELRPGATAAENAPVIILVDAAPKTIVAYPDEAWAGRVQVGDRARATPSDGRGAPLSGVVYALAPRIAELPARFSPVPGQPSFGRAVRINVPGDHGGPLPGQAFDVVFHGSAP